MNVAAYGFKASPVRSSGRPTTAAAATSADTAAVQSMVVNQLPANVDYPLIINVSVLV